MSEDRNPEPQGKVDEDGHLWLRDTDGNWQKYEQKTTGDPQLDALWDMPVDQLNEIITDRNHGLHDKAMQVSTQTTSPLSDSLQSLNAPLREILSEQVARGFSSLNHDSLFGEMGNEVGRVISRRIAKGKPAPRRDTEVQSVESPHNSGQRREIPLKEVEEALTTLVSENEDATKSEGEHTSSQQPVFSMGQLRAFTANAGRHLADGNAVLAQIRDETTKSSQDATYWAEKSDKKANHTLWISVASALAVVLTLLMTILSWTV